MVKSKKPSQKYACYWNNWSVTACCLKTDAIGDLKIDIQS
jgi:hypothetical protein